MKDSTYFGPQTKAVEISMPLADWKKTLSQLNDREVTGLLITQELEDTQRYSLSFLSDIAKKEQITKIAVHAECDDCQVLYGFSQLNELSLGNSSHRKISLALEHFPHLKKLSLTGSYEVSGVEAIYLEALSLAQIKEFPFPKLTNGIRTLYLRQVPLDFSSLQHITTWRQIDLIQEKNTNFVGLHTESLEQLSIAYCPNLTDFDFLYRCERLRVLELDRCKHLDSQKFYFLQALEKLILSDCGKVPSLHFLNSMKSLKFFSCVGTEVLDGDLTPCLKLAYAAADNKKKYNLKASQLPGYRKTTE